jgi:hypothetical protein
MRETESLSALPANNTHAHSTTLILAALLLAAFLATRASL